MDDRMRRALGLGILASWPVLVGAATPKAPAPDPNAIADEVMVALGGAEAWNATHYLRFDFAVERGGKTLVTRAHTWDKWSGRYRLEGKNKKGEPTLALMNLNTKDGKAYLNGKELSGAEAKKALEDAYATWVNDTYWLIMPYKMKDPGVHLAYGGQRKLGAESYDVLVLTFGNVGLTPKDKYWAFINKKTHLMDKWEFVLTGEKGPPEAFLWKNWQRYGKIMLSPEKAGATEKIVFPVLAVPDAVAEAAFASQEPGK
jgi:hypothetical protein